MKWLGAPLATVAALVGAGGLCLHATGVVTGAPVSTLAASMTADQVKIMPLGDSITFGFPDRAYGGYRHLLATLLKDDGYAFEFVGSVRSGVGAIPSPDNEGHIGWTIAMLRNGIDSKGWLETYQPSLVLLHIGTNDFRLGQGAGAPARLSELLDDILTRLPRARVIVAQIIAPRGGNDAGVRAYNGAIPSIVQSKGSRVSAVDLHDALGKGDYADALHPSATGYDKMARAWEPAIRAVLGHSSAGPWAAMAKRALAGRPSGARR